MGSEPRSLGVGAPADLKPGLDVALNLDANAHNNFFPMLKAARQTAHYRARELPAAPNPGVGGK